MASLVQLILNNNFTHLDDQQIAEAFNHVLTQMEQYISEMEAMSLPIPTTPLSRQSQVYEQHDLSRAERGWDEYYEAIDAAMEYMSDDDESIIALKDDESPIDNREGCARCSGCMFCMDSDGYDGNDEI